MALEILDGALVRLGFFARAKRSEIASFAR